MKKRTIIAIIITIFTLFCSNKLWLDFSPMSVDFDILGKGECNIEAQLNKKDNNEFKQIKSQGRKINLEEISHVRISVERSKFPKRIRFVFNDITDDNQIEIKNITLKNGKYKLDDLKAFSINNGKLAYSDNTIQITPPQAENSMILTYNKPIDIRTSVKFDFKIFIVILVLTYLLAYKLTDYIANFNTIKHQSRIEIIFLLIFFIFLFVPMSHINQNKYSLKENRAFAIWKPLIKKNGGINFNFGKDYNSWFNDRFNLRPFFLNSQIKILMPITKKLPKGFIYPNDYIFSDNEIENKLGEINQQDYEALIKFDKYCKEHNIELYVLLVPSRKYIYPPTKDIYIKDEYALKIYEKVKELNQKYNMHIVNPLKELKEGTKNTYTYFKADPHWTFDGAYIGYKELMKEINKKHQDIYVLQENDFNYYESYLVNSNFNDDFIYGYNSTYMNLPEQYIKKIHNTKYRYYIHKKANRLKIKTKVIPYHLEKNFFYPNGADYRVIVLGTSMTENLDEFIPYTFKNVFHIRNNNVKNIPNEDQFKIIKYHEKDILEYKPNIIVFCITYGNMTRLRQFFEME